MNLAQFFEHWGIAENPFRGEEARHDGVFSRLAELSPEERTRLSAGTGVAPKATHSDFEKILGNLSRPSTSIVFGEKGSGKTAIRLQIGDSVEAHNQAHPDRKVFMVAYDELNGVLDQIHLRRGKGDVDATFKKIRLVDHVDAILSAGVTGLVGTLLTGGGSAKKAVRSLTGPAGDDLLVLQSVYDAELSAHQRTRTLRKMVGRGRGSGALLWDVLLFLGWVPALAFVLLATLQFGLAGEPWVLYAFLALLGLYVLVLGKVLLLDRWSMGRLGRRVEKEMVAVPRGAKSYAASLADLPADLRAGEAGGSLPLTSSEESRYAMMDRFRRVLRELGYTGLLVVIDRVDEPVLVNGDAERMRSIIWPLLNNKFLQQDGFGVKMLLPIELRHALYKESSRFFQEARLDKQNLVDRLTWSGAMLYDTAEARLLACRVPGAEGDLALLDLFAEDVTRQDLVDALDQMHQPRDAFKFLYQCLTEHCSNVTAGEQAFRVPRLVLDGVRKQQADRVQALYRGISPA